jgi:hypothetical protein
MTIDDLKSTANAAALPPLLRALWHDARGEWDAAHQLAQDVDDGDGAWVHAYLHRKEGDAGNAAYWYQRASQPVASDSLAAEWERIAADLLTRHPPHVVSFRAAP